jgi:hypothetical protein
MTLPSEDPITASIYRMHMLDMAVEIRKRGGTETETIFTIREIIL